MTQPEPASQQSISVNGEPVEVPRGASVADLIVQLEIQSRAIAVEINGEIQSSNTFATQSLQAGDQIEIVTLVGGG